MRASQSLALFWGSLLAEVPRAASLGEYIAKGLANDDVTSNASVATSPSPTVSSISSLPLATGSGTAYASSCQAALWAWKQSSEQYGSQHEFPTTWVSSSGISEYYTYTDFTGSVSATRLTTLCDGYPRVIGSAKYLDISTATISYGGYTITTSDLGAFTTPPPCSIGPSDCSNLWTSFASYTSASLVFLNGSALEPPCATEPGNTTIPFATASCAGFLDAGSGIFGSQVRLLYWPVRTSDIPNPDWCSRFGEIMTTPPTIPGTPTGTGPNTFVTGSITITSPAVALSFSGLHRGDGCGPTVDHTIITLLPEQLTSVQGARAAYGWYPFNLADLNWKCESPNGTFTIQDTNGGDNCYQDVRANAYFGANPIVDYARGITTGLTIVNNYKPYVIPNPTVGADMISSIWGRNASWWIDGIWDPPIALTQASAADGYTLPGGPSAWTTSTATAEAESTPATPAQYPPTSGATATALPDYGPTTSSQGVVVGPDPSSDGGNAPHNTAAGNPGAIIASLLGSSGRNSPAQSSTPDGIGPGTADSTVSEGPVGGSQNTLANPGGIIASLLGGHSGHGASPSAAADTVGPVAGTGLASSGAAVVVGGPKLTIPTHGSPPGTNFAGVVSNTMASGPGVSMQGASGNANGAVIPDAQSSSAITGNPGSQGPSGAAQASAHVSNAAVAPSGATTIGLSAPGQAGGSSQSTGGHSAGSAASASAYTGSATTIDYTCWRTATAFVLIAVWRMI